MEVLSQPINFCVVLFCNCHISLIMGGEVCKYLKNALCSVWPVCVDQRASQGKVGAKRIYGNQVNNSDLENFLLQIKFISDFITPTEEIKNMFKKNATLRLDYPLYTSNTTRIKSPPIFWHSGRLFYHILLLSNYYPWQVIQEFKRVIETTIQSQPLHIRSQTFFCQYISTSLFL